MKRLIRPILEGLLGLLVIAGAGGTWWMWNKASITQAELTSVSNELEASRAAIESMSERMQGLQRKSNELDAVRAALASGVALEDIEAAARGRPPSAERMLAQGAIRMLTKGSTDNEVKQLFEKALELVEWNARLRSVCAAQAGLIAAGQKMEMLADCRTLAAAEAAAAAAAKAAAAQAAAAQAAAAQAAAAPQPAARPGTAPAAKGGSTTSAAAPTAPGAASTPSGSAAASPTTAPAKGQPK
jgi:hypothetical protein